MGLDRFIRFCNAHVVPGEPAVAHMCSMPEQLSERSRTDVDSFKVAQSTSVTTPTDPTKLSLRRRWCELASTLDYV